jgi:hypothetical protein
LRNDCVVPWLGTIFPWWTAFPSWWAPSTLSHHHYW